jgi:hypothetical protein
MNDPGVASPKQPSQCGLAVQERPIAQILAIVLQEVERVTGTPHARYRDGEDHRTG